MNRNETIEGNKLIAEFVELTTCTDKNHVDDKCYVDPFGTGYIKANELKYHSSWDWLMKAVEKIELFNLEVEIFRNQCWINWLGGGADKYPWLEKFDDMDIHYKGEESINKITATWIVVVQFIKWYNSQQNNNQQ